jgi:hypothetical protein
MKTLPCGHPENANGPGGCRVCAALARRAAKKAALPAEPNLLQKAISLTAAATRHLAAGRPRVDDATFALRMAACGGCEMRLGTDERPRCRICGCGLATKARWAGQVCPHPDGPRWPGQGAAPTPPAG